VVPVGPGLTPATTAPLAVIPDRRAAIHEPGLGDDCDRGDADHAGEDREGPALDRAYVRRDPPPGRDAIPGPFTAASPVGSVALAEPRPALSSTRVAIANAELTERGVDRAVRMTRSALRETAALLRDLGVPMPSLRRAGDGPSQAEALGSGLDAAVAARITERVRSVFGLSQTLSTALRTDQGLIGAIVLSRRDRERWS